MRVLRLLKKHILLLNQNKTKRTQHFGKPLHGMKLYYFHILQKGGFMSDEQRRNEEQRISDEALRSVTNYFHFRSRSRETRIILLNDLFDKATQRGYALRPCVLPHQQAWAYFFFCS